MWSTWPHLIFVVARKPTTLNPAVLVIRTAFINCVE